jgi:hypothetical protein
MHQKIEDSSLDDCDTELFEGKIDTEWKIIIEQQQNQSKPSFVRFLKRCFGYADTQVRRHVHYPELAKKLF